MRKELKQVGLKAPAYFTKSFLLQAVVDNAANQNVAIDTILKSISKESTSKPTTESILKLYQNIEVNQIFTVAEATVLLNCRPSKGRRIIALLRGQGGNNRSENKGKWQAKYRFVNADEA